MKVDPIYQRKYWCIQCWFIYISIFKALRDWEYQNCGSPERGEREMSCVVRFWPGSGGQGCSLDARGTERGQCLSFNRTRYVVPSPLDTTCSSLTLATVCHLVHVSIMSIEEVSVSTKAHGIHPLETNEEGPWTVAE